MLLTTVLCLTLLSQSKEGRLPGSGLTTESAGQEADIILVAKVIQGGPCTGSHGDLGCSFFKVKTSATIKGGLAGQEVQMVSFLVKKYSFVESPRQKGEAIPKVGDDYVFFIKKFGRIYDAIKILRKTKENLRAVGGGP